MAFDEYIEHDALGIAKRVRDGDVKAREVVEAAITRIELYNNKLNAVVSEIFDKSLRWADALDAKKDKHNLDGVPILLKDMGAASADMPFTMGSKLMAQFVPKADDLLVSRFKQAGCLFLGTSNVPEFGLVATTESQLHGACRNPWDPSRSPGGSSGGAAAAVAARFVPVAHASDGGGSIRSPASNTGLVGLKPTRARISQGPYLGEVMAGLTNEHVVTRSVRDSAAFLKAIAGPIDGDPYVAPNGDDDWLDAVTSQPKGLKVAVSAHSWTEGYEVDPEILAAVDQTARTLEALGHHVEYIDLGALSDQFTEPLIVLWSTSTLANREVLEKVAGRPITVDDVEAHTWTMFEFGQRFSSLDYYRALKALYRNCYKLADRLANYDLLLSPTTSQLAPTLGEIDVSTSDYEELASKQYPYSMYNRVFNASGQPAISLPLGFSKQGLPFGLQFVGRYGDEKTLFAISGQLEQAMPWADRQPDLSVFSETLKG